MLPVCSWGTSRQHSWRGGNAPLGNTTRDGKKTHLTWLRLSCFSVLGGTESLALAGAGGLSSAWGQRGGIARCAL